MTVTAALADVDARDSGVPASVLVSICLHVIGMLAFVRMGTLGPKADEVTVNDVEFMIEQEKLDPDKPKPAARRAVHRQKLAKDFLKLALPSMPKPRIPLEVKAPEIERRPLEIPKEQLRDRGKMQSAPKLAALDLSKERPALAKIQAPLIERDRRVPAALPKLDEVGVRAAPRKVIQLDALRERTGAPAMKSVEGAMKIDLGTARRTFEASALTEAAPAPTTRRKSLADILPDAPAIDLGPRAAPISRPKPKFEEIAQPLPARKPVRTVQEAPQKQKAVEIEGEIENRRVVARSIPRFPQWAVDQGLIQAEVRIKFFVGASGAVLEDELKVERSSGYGRLDRLAMDHLKKWRFEPLPFGSKNEYGIITFRFLLE
ncbi:MAG: hypothetical protein AUJ52_03780 [Elusimicrobia bacterium CG1_02_63_36]|nr:MAG: hypothetical protein AUJ52_03780 [Elusimicrobia bacterium CG1_02_63_36]